ncbi:hypothetical protein CCP3SC1AL1_1300005 [Gammaproteobacteria bacterium]
MCLHVFLARTPTSHCMPTFRGVLGFRIAPMIPECHRGGAFFHDKLEQYVYPRP